MSAPTADSLSKVSFEDEQNNDQLPTQDRALIQQAVDLIGGLGSFIPGSPAPYPFSRGSDGVDIQITTSSNQLQIIQLQTSQEPITIPTTTVSLCADVYAATLPVPSVDDRLLLAILEFCAHETRLAIFNTALVPALQNTTDASFIFLYDESLIRRIFQANNFRPSTFKAAGLHGYKIQTLNNNRTIVQDAAGLGLNGQLWKIREISCEQYDWRLRALRVGYVPVLLEVEFLNYSRATDKLPAIVYVYP